MAIAWGRAVEAAIRRLTARTGSAVFTRRELLDAELDAIVAATGSAGATPHQTLSRELQQLRDAGTIEFVDAGTYRSRGDRGDWTAATASKGVFVVGSQSIYKDEPDRFYRFGPQWLNAASRIAGNWIVYQEPRRAGNRGYYAAAKVERIVPDPATDGMYLALIAPGTFLEFGQDVAFRQADGPVEHGLVGSNGRLNNGRAVQSIRLLSDADFNRIVALGLVDEEALMPRTDEAVGAFVREEALPWEGPVDRVTTLIDVRRKEVSLILISFRYARALLQLSTPGRSQSASIYPHTIGDPN